MSTAESPTRDDDRLERQVRLARDGDHDALEEVVVSVQPQIRALAVRFLWHPDDANDATQEILIRILTRLGTFEGRSRFRTWVYRVAVNALLSMQPTELEKQSIGFDEFAADLGRGLGEGPSGRAHAEETLLLEEVKVGCTHAMLQCLDRKQRLAFILGEILELDHREGAEVLEISPAAFRQRLSRARRQLTDFLQENCGLFDPANACRCSKRAGRAVELRRIDPDRLLFARDRQHARRFPEVLAEIRKLEAVRRTAALYRSHAEPAGGTDLAPRLRELLEGLR